jgi:hypothetical protein
MRNYFLLCSLVVLLFALASCGAEKEGATLATSEEYELVITDSLRFEYLGNALLVDKTSDGKFLLIDAQRNAYLIIDKEGNILHQFTLSSDDRDYPGITFESPAFYEDYLIVFNGRRGTYFFDFDGNFIEKTEKPIAGSVYVSRLGYKGTFSYREGNEPYLIMGNPDFFENDENTQEFYDEFKAVIVFHLRRQEATTQIGLEQGSIYLDGRKHSSDRLLSRMHMDGDQLALLYNKDPQLYVYKFREGQFALEQSWPLNLPDLYLDTQPERNPTGESSRGGFSIGKMGEGDLRSVWFKDDLYMVIYNPGLAEAQRLEPKIVQTENSITIKDPDNIPKDRFAIYRNGALLGSTKQLPAELDRMIMGDGDFIWFRKTENEEEESDFLVWYKVKLEKK